MGDQLGASRSLVQNLGLIRRIDGTDGDPVDSPGDQVLDHGLLVLNARRHMNAHIEAELLARMLYPGLGDGPEGSDTVAHEGHPLLLSRGGGGAARGGWRRRVLLRLTSSDAQNGDGEDAETTQGVAHRGYVMGGNWTGVNGRVYDVGSHSKS